MCERSFFFPAFPAGICGEKLSGTHCMKFLAGCRTVDPESAKRAWGLTRFHRLHAPCAAEEVLCIRNHTVRKSIPRIPPTEIRLILSSSLSILAIHTSRDTPPPAQFGRRVCVGGLSPGYPTMCWRSGTAVRIQQELARSSRTPPAADFHRRCREPTSEHLHAPGRSRRGVSDEPLATGGRRVRSGCDAPRRATF